MSNSMDPSTNNFGEARRLPADPRRIKALALDLDGTTLAPGAILRESTLRALRACMGRGIRVIINTGRSLGSVEPFRARIGAEGPLVCFNGAEVVDMPEGRILGLSFLDTDIVDYCIDLARQLGVYFQLYIFQGRDRPGELLAAGKSTPEAEAYRARTGIQAVFGDLKEFLGRPDFEGCIKGMFIAEPELLDKIRPSLEGRFGGRAYITKSSPTFLEILAAGVSKGAGLKIAMDHYRLKADEVIAFGDEENDLPMFTVAGYAAVPANAGEQVLCRADVVIGSNDEDGVAAFLTGFFGL